MLPPSFSRHIRFPGLTDCHFLGDVAGERGVGAHPRGQPGIAGQGVGDGA